MSATNELPYGAELSECRRYRYALWRTWSQADGHVMFIGLNPSTADENTDDPTIRRCIGFARSWGYGGIYMLNLFAFRSTDPDGLLECNNPIGPGNNRFLEVYFKSAARVVAAWGRHRLAKKRASDVCAMLMRDVHHNNPLFYCLGRNGDGSPKHPLYIAKDTALDAYYCQKEPAK